MTPTKADKDSPQKSSADSASGEPLEGTWPLEAGRLSLGNPLMECLAVIATEFGRRTTVNALMAGLPISASGMPSPALFVRAAERAHLSAKMVRRKLSDIIHSPNLPCILVLKNDQACILKKKLGGKGRDIRLQVLFPETPDEATEIAAGDLAERFGGYAFFVRPTARVDDRAGPSSILTGRDWFWSALRMNKKIYIEVGIAAVMINVIGLAGSLFTMNVYDRVIPNQAFDTLWVLAVGVATAYIFDFILRNLRSHFLDAAGRRADLKISARIFEQMLGMKMAARPPSAGVLAAHMREFEGLRDFFTSATITGLIDLPFAFFFIFLIFVLSGSVAIVPAVIAPLVLLAGWLLQKPLNKIIQESMRQGAFKNGLLIEAISGIETIKVQAAEGHTQRNWEELVEHSSLTAMKAKAVASLAVNFASLATNLSTVGIIIVGTYQISAGNVTMGALIAAVILSGRAMAPLAQVASIMTKYSQSKEALERLDQLMSSPVERPMDQHFINRPLIDGRIEFRNVVFSYPNQPNPVLHDVSFMVQPGERVGVIGAVGSGKTTIERLILNLYQPDSGSVQIDGTDVRQIDPADLRRNIGVVQQTPYLFYGSVRDNITLGHETVPESALLRAAEMAGVLAFLRDTQAGLDSPVGERGDLLSGGQRQAIAIARALLYDPPVLLMDEPTASIDPASERRLYNRLEAAVEGKTVLLITHKSTMLGLVDKLILMDRGRIVDIGPRDDVIKRLQEGQYTRGRPGGEM